MVFKHRTSNVSRIRWSRWKCEPSSCEPFASMDPVFRCLWIIQVALPKKAGWDAEGIRLSGVEARKRGCLGCAAHGQSVVGQSMANQREVSVSRNWFSTKKAILIAKKRWQLTGCLWHWQSQMIPHVSVDRIWQANMGIQPAKHLDIAGKSCLRTLIVW